MASSKCFSYRQGSVPLDRIGVRALELPSVMSVFRPKLLHFALFLQVNHLVC